MPRHRVLASFFFCACTKRYIGFQKAVNYYRKRLVPAWCVGECQVSRGFTRFRVVWSSYVCRIIRGRKFMSKLCNFVCR